MYCVVGESMRTLYIVLGMYNEKSFGMENNNKVCIQREKKLKNSHDPIKI